MEIVTLGLMLGKNEFTLRKIPATIAASPPNRIRFALDILSISATAYFTEIDICNGECYGS
jgi:hypothetical protein